MSLKARDVDRIFKKFEFKTREGRDRLAWFEYNGRPVVYTKRSHGRKIVGAIEHFIRQQMKLSEADFRGAHRCTVTKDDYIEILRRKGLLK